MGGSGCPPATAAAVNVLLDHCVPRPFRRELPGHRVRTTFEMGWSRLSNGALLAEAARHFGVIITVDQNIRYQHDLSALPLPVLVLVADDNDPETLRPFGPFVLAALEQLGGPVMQCIYADGRVDRVSPGVP